MWKFIVGLTIVILASFWAVKPLTSAGFFPMHDDTQVARIVVMGRALRNGQFPVRWVWDLGYGYGYPIFNFYGPLPYYVGGGLYAIGLTGLTATKLMFALGIIFAGVTMYFALVGFVGQLGAILAAILYLYAPYHAVQIYVRGAVGEFWVLVFLPLILWSILVSCRKTGKDRKAILVGGIGLAGTVVSHTILGYVTIVLFVLSTVLYWAIQSLRSKFDQRLVKVHILTLVTGLGLSASFWLPALAEMHFTNVAGQIGASANFMDHFVCLSQLWNSPWGFGGSVPGCNDGLSFKLGKLNIIVAVLALGIWLLKRKNVTVSLVPLGLGIVLVAIFFMLPVSAPLWRVLPDSAFIQYPWRFLAFAIFGLSVLSGAVVLVSRNALMRTIITFVVVTSAIAINAKLFVPQYLYAKDPAAFETSEELRWRVSKISDEYLPPEVTRPKDASFVAGDVLPQTNVLSVETEIDRETYIKLITMTGTDQNVTIERAYFPGWHYWVNGKEIKPNLTGGLPVLPVPAGRSVVELRFINTPVRLLSNILSIITILALLYVYGKKTYA